MAAAAVNIRLININDFHGRIALTKDGDSQQVTAPGPDEVSLLRDLYAHRS